MNLIEIEKVMESNGIKICPICSTPFTPYHSRQKTCGSPECMRARHNDYQRDKAKSEQSKERHREANRKWRAKKSYLQKREGQLNEIIERTQKQVDFDNYIREHGHEYGKLQAEKTLAQVPKIDVNIDTKGEKDNEQN